VDAVQTAQRAVHIVAASVGFTSFFLIWLAIVWGLMLRNGWAATRMRHARIYGIHQTIAVLGLSLGTVHALAQLAAPLGHVRPIDEFVPFLNAVDPIGLGVGVIGLEVIAAASLSVLIQRKLGFSRWRALHVMTYAAFMLIVAHVLLSGSDVGPPWVWGSVMGAWLTTVVLWLMTTPWLRTILGGTKGKFSLGRRGVEVSVDVDPVRCKRFGFCEHDAPEVFKLRSDGRLSYLASVPADQVDSVIRAMKVCPARAITISQMPTSVMTAPRSKATADRTPSDPGPADRGPFDRSPFDRGPFERGAADRGTADGGAADRGSADRGLAGRGPLGGPRSGPRQATVTGLHRQDGSPRGGNW
jgi:ferredoxin/DMSO/TMAO reductase YedYZ heme-binding membrane subunit